MQRECIFGDKSASFQFWKIFYAFYSIEEPTRFVGGAIFFLFSKRKRVFFRIFATWRWWWRWCCGCTFLPSRILTKLAAQYRTNTLDAPSTFANLTYFIVFRSLWIYLYLREKHSLLPITGFFSTRFSLFRCIFNKIKHIQGKNLGFFFHKKTIKNVYASPFLSHFIVYDFFANHFR